MKKIITLSVLILLPTIFRAQFKLLDSLRSALTIAHTDSARFVCLYNIGEYNLESNSDTALFYFDKAYAIAKENEQALDEAAALAGKGHEYIHLGKFPESFECLQQAFGLLEKPVKINSWYRNHNFNPDQMRLWIQEVTNGVYGILMNVTSNNEQEIIQYQKAIKIANQLGDLNGFGFNSLHLGEAYINQNNLDSALLLQKRAIRIFEQIGVKENLGYAYRCVAKIYQLKGKRTLALQNYYTAIKIDSGQRNDRFLGVNYGLITDFYLGEKQKDSSLYYAKKTLKVFNSIIDEKFLYGAYENLYKSYKLNGKTDSAYKYLGLALVAKDSSFNATAKSLADFQKLSFKSQLRAIGLEKEKEAIQTRIRTYVLLVGIFLFMLLAIIFYRINQTRKKTNIILSHQKEEIQNALAELKSTQAQLIQSEKMASLGELSAGIAHEIQNPLNFVNNFSEVSNELLDEMRAELASGNNEEAIAIADDIKQNLEKINHHGKRADAIVKGMLQHSRKTGRQKEYTDINALADEYLRLSYHGLRAKDKQFNAEIKTDFDDAVGKVNIIPQDIGRVLLNLFNNAFWAVGERLRVEGEGYQATISVSTKKVGNMVEIKVADNGTGIPDAVKDKIMQPFFTTKPTGQGTGLGLSLSYDIVKAHGGSIVVESSEGQGTTFSIILPVS